MSSPRWDWAGQLRVCIIFATEIKLVWTTTGDFVEFASSELHPLQFVRPSFQTCFKDHFPGVCFQQPVRSLFVLPRYVSPRRTVPYANFLYLYVYVHSKNPRCPAGLLRRTHNVTTVCAQGTSSWEHRHWIPHRGDLGRRFDLPRSFAHTNHYEIFVVAIQVQKLLIVMHLLIGEVPERKTFDMPQYKKALVPYFELTQVGCIWNMHRAAWKTN